MPSKHTNDMNERWLALRDSCSFVCLVGRYRGTKRQTKKKELTPLKTVIKTSIGGPFLRRHCVLAAIALGFFALAPGTQAVVPPPDGGYPGGNTAEGQDALLSLTSGTYDTAVGLSSLRSDTVASFNSGIGAGALLANTGSENTAIGAEALLSNSSGSFNTANGAFALVSNTTGLNNTANGGAALFSNTGGNYNTANGASALASNTTGSNNTANGEKALTGIFAENRVNFKPAIFATLCEGILFSTCSQVVTSRRTTSHD